MRQTPLTEEHKALGAKLMDFHGWEMPLQYRGILEEHHHTRSKTSLFDCCHMGEFRIRGREAIKRYDCFVISDVEAIKVGRARYGAVLNERGGIIDDIVTVRLEEEELMVVCNAGPRERLAHWIGAGEPGIEDISDVTAKIDVQGPLARQVVTQVGFAVAGELRYFHGRRVAWEGVPTILTRLGYTGELGFEIYLPNDHARDLWRALLAVEDVAPAGLGARDTLRLEMGYLLSGQDFDESTGPLEAGQGPFIAWESQFIGKEAVEARRKTGRYPVLTGVRAVDRRAPRRGFDVYANEHAVGRVTSGTFGPSVGCGIGLAYVPQSHATPGARLTVGPRRLEVETAALPFYTEGTCRK